MRLLKSPVTAIEIGDQPVAAFAGRGVGVEQRLHFVAPELPLIGAAHAAQVLQGAHDLCEPLQVAVIGRWPAFGRVRSRGTERNQNKTDKDVAHWVSHFRALCAAPVFSASNGSRTYLMRAANGRVLLTAKISKFQATPVSSARVSASGAPNGRTARCSTSNAPAKPMRPDIPLAITAAVA